MGSDKATLAALTEHAEAWANGSPRRSRTSCSRRRWKPVASPRSGRPRGRRRRAARHPLGGGGSVVGRGRRVGSRFARRRLRPSGSIVRSSASATSSSSSARSSTSRTSAGRSHDARAHGRTGHRLLHGALLSHLGRCRGDRRPRRSRPPPERSRRHGPRPLVPQHRRGRARPVAAKPRGPSAAATSVPVRGRSVTELSRAPSASRTCSVERSPVHRERTMDDDLRTHEGPATKALLRDLGRFCGRLDDIESGQGHVPTPACSPFVMKSRIAVSG